VNVLGEAPRVSAPNVPVEVTRDNPTLIGQFASHTGESGTSKGDYSHEWAWTGLDAARLELREQKETGALNALVNAAPRPCAETVSAPSPLAWRFTGNTLVHGNVNAANAFITHGDTHAQNQAQTLWTRLSRDVSVIPVLAIAWHGNGAGDESSAQGIAAQIRPLFDYLPTDPEQPSTSGSNRVPNQFLGRLQIPPDEIGAPSNEISVTSSAAIAAPRSARRTARDTGAWPAIRIATSTRETWLRPPRSSPCAPPTPRADR
jgi:hypothetical protein